MRNCRLQFHISGTVLFAKGYYFFMSANLRLARDEDSAGVIQLIQKVFEEYENCFLDVESEEPKLLKPASSYHRFWIVEQQDAIVGSIACGSYPRASRDKQPHAPQAESYFELQKLYVAAPMRGKGWGRRLIEVVEQEAVRMGYSQIELWSDTRFETAHHVYQALGYNRTGRIRELDDISQTVEYHFLKNLPTEG